MKRLLLLVLVSLMLAACAPVAGSTEEPEGTDEVETPEIELSETFTVGTPFWLAIDGTAAQQDGELQITFLDVTEDSRCPVGGNIQCAWSGQVTTLLEVKLHETAMQPSLTIPDPRSGISSAALFDQYTIQLLEVQPVPASLDPIERSLYRAQIVIHAGTPTPTPATPTFALGEPFWINLDDTMKLASGGLELYFLDVPKDERCPVSTDIQCAEEGPVVVTLDARHNGGSTWAMLSLPDTSQFPSRMVVFDIFTIELLAVEPPRTSMERVERSQYRAQIVVTQNEPADTTPGVTPTPAPAEIEPSGTFALAEPFWLEVGQMRSLDDGSLGLAFLGVTEDSRCPPTVQCVWAGQVTILLQATLGPTAGQASLTFPHSQMGDSRAGLFGLYSVEILAIEPAASLDPIPQSAYRAQLLVTEGVPPDVTPIGVTAAPSPTP